MSIHDSSLNEKEQVAQNEFADSEKISSAHGHGRGSHVDSTKAEIERIDAAALGEGVTLESFKHLDEKKILRKV